MTKLALTVLAVLAASTVPAAALTPGQLCEKSASDALRKCVSKIGKQQQKCYQTTGSACLGTDAKMIAAHASTEKSVLQKCPDQPTVAAALYGPVLTPAGLVARMNEACDSAAASLAARSFGGPHAAVRDAATATDIKCLDGAYKEGLSLIGYGLKEQSSCVRKVHEGKTCDTASVASKLASRESKSALKIGVRCPTPTESLVTVDAATLASRAAAQARCLVASAHGQTSPLTLDCGPRAAVPVPPLASPTQIILDSDTWGTRCGDGSDYAFWVRPAPAGQPIDRIVVFMQGGGACYDGPTCADQPAARFTSINQNLPTAGIMSSTNASNPFRYWTKVYLPYCTQDLHLGGGVTNEFDEVTVQRYGAINTRTALRYVRDMIWSHLDATDPEGYRGDGVRMLFTGGSAGGFGNAYNYHWVLDDLRWTHTTAAPDSGLGMDNGTPVGVITLGAVAKLPETPGWNVGPYLPPYCTTAECAEIFDNLQAATSPRLKMLPEQQILNITNQIDGAQAGTTFFPSITPFVNTMRTNYCNLQGSTGIRNFFSGRTASQHIQVNNNIWYYGAVVGGTTLAQWLADAMASPDTVIDKIALGTLQADYPGIQPFPCTVGSPSGALFE